MRRFIAFGALSVLGLGAAVAVRAGGSTITVRAASEQSFKQLRPGVQAAALFGDPAREGWGAIHRVAAGNEEPWHTHSHLLRLVVISGALSVAGDGAAAATDLGAGSFVEVPPNVRHRATCGSGSDCVYFVTQAASYDRMLDGSASGRPGVNEDEAWHQRMLQEIWSGP